MRYHTVMSYQIHLAGNKQARECFFFISAGFLFYNVILFAGTQYLLTFDIKPFTAKRNKKEIR